MAYSLIGFYKTVLAEGEKDRKFPKEASNFKYALDTN